MVNMYNFTNAVNTVTYKGNCDTRGGNPQTPLRNY